MPPAVPAFLYEIGVLRREITNHPLLFLIAVWLVLTAARKLLRRDSTAPPYSGRLVILLAALGLGAYVATVVWYQQSDQYADAAEPTMAAIAWLFELGRPIYHGVDTAERYSHVYGPMAFIIPGWTLALLGPDIGTSKIAGTLAGLLSAGVVFLLTRAVAGRTPAVVLTGWYALCCLMFQNVSFWIRPDSFELLFAAGALAAVASWPRALWSACLLGLATGVLVNLKFTAPAYVFPAFALLIVHRRWWGLVAASVVAAIAAIMPFIAYDNVSFANLELWVRLSARNGLLAPLLRRNAEWSVFLLIPWLAHLRRDRLDPVERAVVSAVALGMGLVAVAGSKPGAGPYHLLPFVPAILYAALLSLRRIGSDVTPAQARIAEAFALSIALIATLQMWQFVQIATRTRDMPIADDLRRTLDRYPTSKIAMGYSGQNQAYPSVRPILVFRQGEYLLDAPAIQEHQLSGIGLPPASLQAIESCQFDIWLIPKDGEPFSLRNQYAQTGHAPLFPESFRGTFFKTYRRETSSEYFDLWRCSRR